MPSLSRSNSWYRLWKKNKMCGFFLNNFTIETKLENWIISPEDRRTRRRRSWARPAWKKTTIISVNSTMYLITTKDFSRAANLYWERGVGVWKFPQLFPQPRKKVGPTFIFLFSLPRGERAGRENSGRGKGKDASALAEKQGQDPFIDRRRWIFGESFVVGLKLYNSIVLGGGDIFVALKKRLCWKQKQSCQIFCSPSPFFTSWQLCSLFPNTLIFSAQGNSFHFIPTQSF